MVEERLAYNPRLAKAGKGFGGYFLSRTIAYNIFFDVNGSFYAIKPDGEKDYVIPRNKLRLMLKSDYFEKAGAYHEHFPPDQEQLSTKKINKIIDRFLSAMTNIAVQKVEGKIEGHFSDSMDVPTEKL